MGIPAPAEVLPGPCSARVVHETPTGWILLNQFHRRRFRGLCKVRLTVDFARPLALSEWVVAACVEDRLAADHEEDMIHFSCHGRGMYNEREGVIAIMRVDRF